MKKYKLAISLVFLLFILTGISSFENAQAGPYRLRPAGDSRVYFATTRYNENRSLRNPDFQNRRHLDTGSGSIDYGYAQVKNPATGQNLESASNFNEFKLKLKTTDQAWSTTAVSDVSGLVKTDFNKLISSWQGTILIFVHGYDESFFDSIRDTAILGQELENKVSDNRTKVLPILFSWPSLDKTTEYSADESNMHWSKLPFRQFMEEVTRYKRRDTKLYLIAHSLGSRMAFDLTNSESLTRYPSIDKLVLSSSDFDYHQALQKKHLLESMVSDKIFVLVSDRDGPLITSQLLHKSPRLGRPFDPPTVSKEKEDYGKKSFWKGLVMDAVDMLAPPSANDTPEVSQWLTNGRTISTEFGNKSKLFDVTELVTGDLGHRLAWPVITSLLTANESLYPLNTRVVHKKPDKLLLEQYGGVPPTLYRFHRISQDRYGLR